MLTFLLSLIELLREPAALHAKFLVLGAWIFTRQSNWGLLLGALVLAISLVAGVSGLSATRKSLQRMLTVLNDPVAWRRIHLDCKRFEVAYSKPPLLSPTHPVTDSHIFFVARAEHKLDHPEAFLSMFGPSVILLPIGYDTPMADLTPLQRFLLYHELAHTTKTGTCVWHQRLLDPVGYAISLTCLTAIPEVPWWIFNPLSALLALFLLGTLGPLARWHTTEVIADSQALQWLTVEDPDAALRVAINRRQVAKRAGFNWIPRARNFAFWERYLTRIAEGKWAMHPPMNNFSMPLPFVQDVAAIILLLSAWSITKESDGAASFLTYLMAGIFGTAPAFGVPLRRRVMRLQVSADNVLASVTHE